MDNFLCECADENCTRRLDLSRSDYESFVIWHGQRRLDLRIISIYCRVPAGAVVLYRSRGCAVWRIDAKDAQDSALTWRVYEGNTQ